MNIIHKTLEELQQIQEYGPLKGIFKVADDDYHKIKAINSTSLKAATISMAHFKSTFQPDPYEPKSTRPDHFAFGSAFHAYVLDKDEFDKSFILKPDLDMRTKEGQLWKKKNYDKHIISEMDMYCIENMANNLYETSFWKDFTCGEYLTEIAMFWIDDETGLQCKAKLDLYNKKQGILDIKTIQKSPTDRNVYYAIKDYRYDVQQSHYVAGLKYNFSNHSENFVLGICEKVAPFSVRNCTFTRNTRDRSQEEYRKLMLDVAYAIRTDSYPAFENEQDLEIELYGN
jgi:hypothetical protein